MHFPSLLLASASLTVALAAQGTELVTNGTFTTTLAPWVMGGGYSVNPGLDTTFNTTGRGISDSFGVFAGGQVTPPPYAPNTIEQTIVVVPAITYEFRADAAGSRPSATANSDIGTIWAEVNGVEVARFAFGAYAAGEVKRAQIVGRFTTTAAGPVTLKVFFQRAFLGGSANPQLHIDNISIRDTAGPTHWIQGNRKINTSVAVVVAGTAGAQYATFLSGGELPVGIPLPGIQGLVFLDPATLVPFLSGTIGTSGQASTPLTLPNNPALLTTPLFFQAVTATPSVIALGYHFGVVCTQ